MDANTNPPSTEPQTFVITRIRLIKETFRITGETEEEAYALLADSDLAACATGVEQLQLTTEFSETCTEVDLREEESLVAKVN